VVAYSHVSCRGGARAAVIEDEFNKLVSLRRSWALFFFLLPGPPPPPPPLAALLPPTPSSTPSPSRSKPACKKRATKARKEGSQPGAAIEEKQRKVGEGQEIKVSKYILKDV